MVRKIKVPHGKDALSVMRELGSCGRGLKENEVKNRLNIYGKNEIPQQKSISIFALVTKQFKNWLVAILTIAAIISLFAGEIIDTWVIAAVVAINASIGFFQEFKAEKAINSLQSMVQKLAKVYRNGSLTIIPTYQLVPGDIMVLEEGDSISADARIVESKNLRTMEASLTGESLPINKNFKRLDKNTLLADQSNMVWKGTFVIGGYARCVVTGTGVNTIIGDISQTLHGIHKKRSTNFMKKIDSLAKQLSIIAISSAALIFLTGYFIRKFEIDQILLTSIAALVAAIPEGLPAIISIVLAIGANRMAKKNAIIREFSACETLGGVTAILTDKTGTLTQNTLTVRKVYIPGENTVEVTGEGWSPAGIFKQNNKVINPLEVKQLAKLLRIAATSNNSQIKNSKKNNSSELVGDPTEGALMALSLKSSLNLKEPTITKIDDLPFDSSLKLRATLSKLENSQELFIIGAPEKILERSTKLLGPHGIIELTNEKREQILGKITEWSKNAMRVIALGFKEVEIPKIEDKHLNNLIFVGLTGMIDPPRPDARNAVLKCINSGIRVIMVTGDHINTALAIAKSTGIIKNNNHENALTEQQLNELNDKEFDKTLKQTSVFARLSPKMKLKIANRFQEMGHSIAMTGDGVNDAPALKKADVGVSMGIMGTDVARESSDIVLADDKFSTIVNAIEEGRIIFTNSRQTIFFLVTTNIAESTTLILSIALGLPIPLIATQILWLNLVTDSFPAIALANEKPKDLIDSSSQKGENLLNKEILPFLFINVIIMTGLSIGVFKYYLNQGIEIARNAAFISMAFTQLFNAFNLRSIHQSIFKIGFFSNKTLNLSVSISALLMIIVSQTPFLASIFHFQPLKNTDFVVLIALSSTIFWAIELYKYIKLKSSSTNQTNNFLSAK